MKREQFIVNRMTRSRPHVLISRIATHRVCRAVVRADAMVRLATLSMVSTKKPEEKTKTQCGGIITLTLLPLILILYSFFFFNGMSARAHDSARAREPRARTHTLLRTRTHTHYAREHSPEPHAPHSGRVPRRLVQWQQGCGSGNDCQPAPVWSRLCLPL